MISPFKLYSSIVCAFILLICPACSRFLEVDAEELGYPSEINIPKDGGTLSFIGSRYVGLGYINGRHLSEFSSSYDADLDLYYYTYEWLTIKTIDYESWPMQPELILIADPNDTGHSRKVIIEIYTGDLYYAKITIKQDD